MSAAGEIIATAGKAEALAMAEALRAFEGDPAVARFRAELGGWHVLVRRWA